jgi:hypothetical protein
MGEERRGEEGGLRKKTKVDTRVKSLVSGFLSLEKETEEEKNFFWL